MDPLLQGLFNYRYFRELVDGELAAGLRTLSSFALAFLDVDHFKYYNDTYGHPTGDIILQKLADALGSEIGEADVLARYGGDEFIALLHGASRPAASAAVLRLQRTVATLSVEGVGETLGISAGLAVYPEDGIHLEELLYVADQSMYANKIRRREDLSVSPETRATIPREEG
jgi:diguanylate cyclase (GGDEF)-like protein